MPIQTADEISNRAHPAHPDEPEAAIEKQQKSIDRARSQAHTILRRSLAELRKLQTERAIRFELDLPANSGLAETRQILSAIKKQPAANSGTQSNPESFSDSFSDGFPDTYAALAALMAQADKADGIDDTSFCESPVRKAVPPVG